MLETFIHAWIVVLVGVGHLPATLQQCQVPDQPRQAGWAYHYHPYPDPWGRSMRQVAAVRGMHLLPWATGYASSRDCRLVDTSRDPTLRRAPWLVIARVAGQTGIYQLVDCSHPRDLALQARQRNVIEVDWSSAAAEGWAVYGGQDGPGRAPAVVYQVCRVRPGP